MTSPTTPRTILGTDYVLDALVAEGLGHLFMVPGGLVDPFLPALARQRKLTPVIAAHEGGAVYMADGYARASGGFGAALGIGGPGCCNHVAKGARRFDHRARRRQGRQELPDSRLRFQRRRARLVLSR